MKLSRVVAAVCLLAASAFSADDAANKIDLLLNAYHDAGMLNGAVLVADHGKVVYKKAFGFANVEWQVPNTTDTKFRIGSVTKPFTAVLIMQQVQAGKIRLDSPMSEYLPDYRKDTGSKVTLRQLLAHTSGIPSYSGKDMLGMHSAQAHADFIKQYCSGDLLSEPGAKYSYNNCGYYLLAAILEKTTGKTYAELLQEKILAPAGMTDSGVDSSRAVLPRRAYGYTTDLATGLQTAFHHEVSSAFGAGDIYSTVEDLYRFDRAIYGDQLLSAETRRLMFTPQSERTALGWFVKKAPAEHPASGDTLQFHEGYIFGYFTMYTRVPEREALVVTIDNSEQDTFDQIHRDIFSILYGRPYALPKQPVTAEIAGVLRTRGAEAAVARYDELKRTAEAKYDFKNWRALNRIGYAFLGAGRAKDAVAMFRLNTEQFPEMWEVWDSLGDGYLGDGQTAAAAASYERSLQLNPENKNASEALQRLRAKQG